MTDTFQHKNNACRLEQQFEELISCKGWHMDHGKVCVVILFLQKRKMKGGINIKKT